MPHPKQGGFLGEPLGMGEKPRNEVLCVRGCSAGGEAAGGLVDNHL